MREASPGKDSVTGHWELAGVVLDRPFPLFPQGFPADALAEFERRIGRPAIGNRAASGTRIIQELGEQHVRTGHPIVYTSADSVFQIAAHETVVPVAQLYGWCEVAYEIMCEGLGVGRVIARPFVGEGPPYRRTAGRRDFARPPAGQTLLDLLTCAGVPVVTLGKVDDLFAGRGVGRSVHGGSDDEVMDNLEVAMAETPTGLLFANLVDFDMTYGHRNDPAGYASNLERFDARLSELVARLRPADLLVITADHGNDPTTPSTDHSREYVPLLVYGARSRGNVDLGTRDSFADVGQTVAELFGVGPLRHGSSFLPAIVGRPESPVPDAVDGGD
jgi:phosphopentomutase